MKIDLEKLKNLSFPDYQVTGMKFFPSERILILTLEGAFYSCRANQKDLNAGILKFSEWKKLTVRMYNATLERWNPVYADSCGHFKEICEIKFEDSNISLAGFNDKDGSWMEWIFENVTVEGEFEN